MCIKKIIESIKKSKIFQQAFVHSSFKNETEEKGIIDYETLEFLGDSILDMYVCLHIYYNYSHYSEGQMSKLKQFMVQEKTLAKLSRELELFNYLRLGMGEKKTRGLRKTSILADVFESFVAALYLERGGKAVQEFLGLTLFTWIKGKEDDVWDYKSQLQEICQSKHNNYVVYKIIKQNVSKIKKFTVEVTDSLGSFKAHGKAKSKKEAEQTAAYNALKKLDGLKLKKNIWKSYDLL